MNVTKPLVVAVAALVALTGTAAAAPGSAPVSTPNETAEDAGPPVDMPDPVPDFVSEIHETIRNALDGAIDGLGGAISDIASGAGDAVDVNGSQPHRSRFFGPDDRRHETVGLQRTDE